MSNLSRFEAMLETTAANMRANRMTLVQRLKELNEQADAHMAANPGDIVCHLTDDVSHWHEYGVHSAEQLDQYLDDAAEHNSRKDNW